MLALTAVSANENTTGAESAYNADLDVTDSVGESVGNMDESDTVMLAVSSEKNNTLSNNLRKGGDENLLGASNDGEILSDSVNFTGTSFSELRSQISSLSTGDTLELRNNVVQDGSGVISISKSITINGNGFTIDAQGRSAIFNIGNVNVELININFINAKNTQGGGAVYFTGSGSVIDSSFVNCTTTIDGMYDGGGAVYFNGRGSVVNSYFMNCSSYTDGGAVLFYNDGDVVASSFVNCSAKDGSGGAVFCFGLSSNNYNIYNSSFVNCSAKNGNGGAVNIRSANGVTINNSSFIDNQANTGRALYTGSNVNILNSIFINNQKFTSGYEVYDYSSSASSNIDYNWWGNNATNYNTSPSHSPMRMVNRDLNNWYFLDMTADDNTANINLNSLYTRNTDEVTVYDDCILPDVNFTLTGSNVRLYGDVVLVENGRATFTYVGDATSLTAAYLTKTITCTNPNMEVNVNTIVEGENATIVVKLPNDARGNVTITVGDRTQTFFLPDNFDGRLIWNVSDLTPGTYRAFANYAGGNYSGGNYIGATDNDKFIVKHKSNITMNCIGGSVGSVAHITATLPVGATGNVTIVVNGRIYSRASGDVLDIPGLKAGNWSVSAYYSGDDYYSSAVAYSNFTIYKKNSTVIIDNINPIEIENGVKITITTNNTEITNETIIVRINGDLIKENITRKVENDLIVFTVNISKDMLDEAGDYIVTADIIETYTYNANSTSKYFTVYKHASEFDNLLITPVNVVVGHNVTINISMKNKRGYTLNSTNVTVRVADKDYLVGLDAEGNGVLVLNLTKGHYDVSARFNGNDLYNESDTVNGNFNVVDKNTTIIDISVDKLIEIENSVTITIITNNIEVDSKDLTVRINGVKYNINSTHNFTDYSEFIVIVPAQKISVAGNYTIDVELIETEWYYKANNSTNFTVYKHNSSVNAISYDPVSGFVVLGHNITIKVEMGQEGNYILNDTDVVVEVDGKNYTVALGDDGKGNLTLNFILLVFTSVVMISIMLLLLELVNLRLLLRILLGLIL